MNNTSNGDAVIRLTNVVASAIAQFQARQQQSPHNSNLPAAALSSSAQSRQPSNLSLTTPSSSNVPRLALILYVQCCTCSYVVNYKIIKLHCKPLLHMHVLFIYSYVCSNLCCSFRQQLPSFLHRNTARQAKKGKAPKITYYNRDVICLPVVCKEINNKSIPFHVSQRAQDLQRWDCKAKFH